MMPPDFADVDGSLWGDDAGLRLLLRRAIDRRRPADVREGNLL
jgi:hypothetical protein